MIIKSILDTDFYKLTQQNSVIQLYPRSKVKYKFFNRGETKFPNGFDEELRKEVKKMETLSLTKQEKEFLTEKCGYFLPPTYIDFLEGYRFDASDVGIIQEGNELIISVSSYWYRAILWEVPLMAIISELYFKMTGEKIHSEKEIVETALKKSSVFQMNNINFADFGTRRRYSYDVHDLVVKTMKNAIMSTMVGTSNVHFAMKYDLKPIGTVAHEFICGTAALKGYAHANKHALEDWGKVYGGLLGIALSDSFTTDEFLKDFNHQFSRLFDGVRHDSGDPIEFAKKIISHYEKLGIDPMSKTIVFSDSLNPEKVLEIQKFCIGKIKTSYGIGTNLTNSVGVKPLNMVIKLVEIDGLNVIKLSDSQGKHTGDEKTIKLVKELLDIN